MKNIFKQTNHHIFQTLDLEFLLQTLVFSMSDADLGELSHETSLDACPPACLGFIVNGVRYGFEVEEKIIVIMKRHI